MKKFVLLFGLVLVAGLVFIFSMPHGMRPQPQPPIGNDQVDPKVLRQVDAEYQQLIEPTLRRACFDCHSTQTVFPWYHAVPGVKQYLEHHVEEGRNELDLTHGLPLRADESAVRALRRIGRVVKNGSMPLWDYLLLHPNARLSEQDKKLVSDWALGAAQKLSATARY